MKSARTSSTHPETASEVLNLEEAARLMRLGLKAMKGLVDSGAVPATRLNQKHTAILREDLISYLRKEGQRQAAARAVGSSPKPRRSSRQRVPPPDLSRYE